MSNRPMQRFWSWRSLGSTWVAAPLMALSSVLPSALSSACTLTAESFEPVAVERGGGELAPAEPGGGTSEPGAPEPSGVPRRSPAAAEDVRVGARSAAESRDTDDGLSRADAGNGGGTDAPAAASEADAALPSLPPLAEPCPGPEFAGSCYEFFDELTTWELAEQRCAVWGGHLASVESPEEDAFLGDWPRRLGVAEGDGSGLWLGGTDAAQDGDFRWSDNSSLGYTGWAASQPDNGVGLDCISKRNDGTERWFDNRCTDELRYVCERS